MDASLIEADDIITNTPFVIISADMIKLDQSKGQAQVRNAQQLGRCLLAKLLSDSAMNDCYLGMDRAVDCIFDPDKVHGIGE